MLNVVIIGGVAAGMSAASKLKRNLRDEVDIVVYEKGGAVSYGACGIPFYVSDHIREEGSLIARSAEAFRESGIDVRLYHEVTSVDAVGKTVSVTDLKTGERFTRPYDKLVVGSGASPNVFAPFDRAYDNLLRVRDLSDGTRLKTALKDESIQDILIIGGGFIGLEIAEACQRYGKNITLVELADHVLSVMDADMTTALTEELERNGVTVRTAAKLTRLIHDSGHITGAELEQSGRVGTIPADLVVNCAGVKPNTAFLPEADKLSNGALMVDETMRTSLPDIYAAGDCSAMESFISGKYQYMPLGTNANKQGRIIADVLGGKQPQSFRLIGSAALRLFGLDVAKVGLSENDAKALGIPYRANTVTGNNCADYYSDEKITIKLVYDPDSKKLLGAQLTGQGTVVPRANYYAVAISSGMTADAFGFTDLCYSPPFSGVWDVSLVAANTCK